MPSKHATTRFWRNKSVRKFRHMLEPTRWYRSATASLRKLPDYVIIGAQKAGTTSLHGYLAAHPQVNVSTVKEVHYFDKSYNYCRGENWYRWHFPLALGKNRHKLCGESSPFYLFCPVTPARMAALLPNAKIIVLLRNPVDRAFSHYQMTVSRNLEPLSFEDAIKAEPERLADHRKWLIHDPTHYSSAYRDYSYLARGIYADQIIEWRKHYSPDQFLILESGEFFSNTPGVFDRALDFLGLDRWHPPEFANLFPSKGSAKMMPTTREQLLDYFAPHNQRLYDELGTEFDWDQHDSYKVTRLPSLADPQIRGAATPTLGVSAADESATWTTTNRISEHLESPVRLEQMG
jgi:hypothetical protein